MNHRYSLVAERNIMLRFASQFALAATAVILLSPLYLLRPAIRPVRQKCKKHPLPYLMICPGSGCNTLRAMSRERLA